MKFKKILSILVCAFIAHTSFCQPTLRELWNEVKEVAEELKEEILNTDISIIFEEEKKPKKTIRYAKNTEEANKAIPKLERKYEPDYECLSSKNPRECLKKIVKAKLAHRSDNPYSDYFEELKAHNKKIKYDYDKHIGFFYVGRSIKLQKKLQKLQTQYKQLFKQELRERY